MTKTYDSTKIKNLQFPESVRKKAQMYVGSTDSHGQFQLLKEVVDNVIDEITEGRATTCQVWLGNNEYFVHDDGPGLPSGTTKVKDIIHNKEHDVPTIKAILGMTHTSGKFNDAAYAASRGTHGLGVKLVNALSSEFEVWTFSRGSWWHVCYREGVIHRDLSQIRKPPTSPFSGALRRGTLVRWVPDLSIITTPKFPVKLLFDYANLSAYFCPSATITVTAPKGSRTFHHKEGIKSYLVHRVKELNATPLGKPLIVSGNPLADVALGFTDYDGQGLRAYTNGLSNQDGGVHVDATYKALHATLKPYIKRAHSFTLNELKEGIVGVVNAKLTAPQFDSQTKDRLVDDRAGAPIQELLIPLFKQFWAANKALAARVCERATQLKKLKSDFTASKKAIQQLNKVKRDGFPAKFATASRCKPEQRWTYLVEGDSAGGSAKQARDKNYQEVMPLKGKPINSIRQPQKALESQEILYLLSAIGFDPKATDRKFRVGRIVLLTDADPDGPLLGCTRVNLVDGTKPTIAELAARWANGDYSPIQVWSVNSQGLLDVAQAVWPRRVGAYTNLVSLEFEGGAPIVCTPNHAWRVLDSTKHPKAFVEGGSTYVKAEDLISDEPAQVVCLDKDVGLSYRKPTRVRIVYSEDPVDMFCMSVPETGNFMVDDGQGNGICSKNSHIEALVFGALWQFCPEVFKRGMVYTVASPEYIAHHPKTKQLVSSRDKDKLVAALPPNTPIKHLKGWGEVDPPILRQLAFDPETARFIKVTAVSSADGVKFVKLMNDDPAARKELLGV